jgi:RHS repeat-associated protein
VAATLGWDAQSGSFSYDANGNMTSSPAPYSVTDATYDHRNLPTALTSGSITTAYRYDHAGQRTHKRVGSGNTEIYVLEGTVTLGVVTVDGSGAVVTSTFNVLADGQVIGRQETGGARLHYHRDLLGSTRAVVQGSTVVESYDYDPWGVLMPGRALAGVTREGFTTKERDGETGLDYFGARYYMAALGRWTSVDPLVDEFPEWSGYNYVLGNPLLLVDPDGRSPCGPEESSADCIARLWNRAQEIGADVVRFGRDFVESRRIDIEGVQSGPGPIVEAIGPGAALRGGATLTRAARRMAAVRAAGRAGENAVSRVPGMTRNTARFGNRIPDFVDRAGNLVEVKNVRRLSFTRQLRELQAVAHQEPGRQFILYTRQLCGSGVSGPCTTLTGPLRREIEAGRIVHRVIPR